MNARTSLLTLLGVGLASTSCLPTDTRPPPSELLITGTGATRTVDGVPATETSDGWAISFSQTLISIGYFAAEGDECALYSSPGYARVMEMTRSGAQKINLVHALGTCILDYELSSSGLDEPVGEGVTEEMQTFMLTPEDDPYSVQASANIYVVGSASKDGVEKTFALAYRHGVDYEACGPIVEDVHMPTTVMLEENGNAVVDVSVDSSALFRDTLDDETTTIGFQVFADADTVYGNDDGEVTLDELEAVPLADIMSEGRYDDANEEPVLEVEDKNLPEELTTLGHYVYFQLFPLILRVEGNGLCRQDRFVNDRTPR